MNQDDYEKEMEEFIRSSANKNRIAVVKFTKNDIKMRTNKMEISEETESEEMVKKPKINFESNSEFKGLSW